MFFFFNDTATTEIYTLSLHDALPISVPAPTDPSTTSAEAAVQARKASSAVGQRSALPPGARSKSRSEEHTSELQSPCNLVCRLLLEKKKDAEPSPEALPAADAPAATL